MNNQDQKIVSSGFYDKSSKFQELTNILDGTLSQEKFEECLKLVYDLYSDDWRHSYSQLTEYFLTNHEYSQLSELFENFSSNITSILTQVKLECENNKDKNGETKREFIRARRALEKLQDHISLEKVRIQYYEYSKQDLISQIKDRETEVKNLRTAISALKNESSGIKETMQNQQVHSVTILGVFSAIVTTLAADIGISASMLSNIDKVDSPTLFLFLFALAIFNGNLILSLFYFLSKIIFKEKTCSLRWVKWFCCFNVGLVVPTAICAYFVLKSHIA